MLSPKVQDAFNKQINAELYSSYLYLSMAAYFEAKDLKGMAHWMRIQADEENGHAMRIFDFINDRSGRVTLDADRGPEDRVEVAAGGFRGRLQARSQKITGMINDLFTWWRSRRTVPATISSNGSAASRSRKRPTRS